MQIILKRRFSQLANLRVDALSTPEQFVLGVCRCWDAFMSASEPDLAWRELAPAFAFMNVLGALCAFDRIFALLRSETLRCWRFNDTDCSALGLDEATMLCALAHLQRASACQTVLLLRETVTPLGLRSMLPPLARIAATLDGQGHRLPVWNDLPVDAPAFARAAVSANRETGSSARVTQ
jgi:hypothetical protein